MRHSISGYGKLPIHPEYLRIGLGSPAALEVVAWIDSAHAAITTSRRSSGRPSPPSIEESHSTMLRFARIRRDQPRIVAGVVARSSDGLREHPITLFTEVNRSPSITNIPGIPLLLEDVWRQLAGIIEGRHTDREEFSAEVQRGCADPGIDESAALTQIESDAGVKGWRSLTGTSGETSLHRAANLLVIVAAQREARVISEGVAISIPLAADSFEDAIRRLGHWLRLLVALAPGPAWSEATILLGLAPARGFLFLRPVDGQDLAAALDGPSLASLDDLGDRWQVLPVENSARHEVLTRLDETPTHDLQALANLVCDSANAWNDAER